MTAFYDRNHFPVGKLVYAGEGNFVPMPGNPSGSFVPALSDDFVRVGYIPSKTPLIVIHRPGDGNRGSMFVRILAPALGDVWVMAGDLRQKP